MGKKAEKGTPKALANAMKSKGLQKLRFYCQLCQKQCRDENGFKCHTMSEGHQRQMLLCADNPGHLVKVTSEFSSDFLGGFLQILRRSYGGKRVSANKVYQDYISDKNHTHMNATRWNTLSGFVQWLGKTGYAKIDFVEEKNQWYLEYIDNSPEKLERDAEKAKLAKSRKDDAERESEAIKAMIERGKTREEKLGLVKEESKFTELKRTENDAPIKVSLGAPKVKELKSIETMHDSYHNPLENLRKQAIQKAIADSKIKKENVKKSALEEIREMEERHKAAQKRKQDEQFERFKKEIKTEIKSEPVDKKPKIEKIDEKWIHKKIVVKIMAKKLGEKFYKQKGFIEKTEDYTAVVQVFENKKRAKIDQADLETVIPSVGRDVVILTGKHRGEVAELKKIESSKFIAKVDLDGKELSFPYESISKLHVKS